jgi:hypothetical protein
MEKGFCGANMNASMQGRGRGNYENGGEGDAVKKCTVKIVKGADHGLMYKSAVVVEVLEILRGFWD